jgi:5'-nucleotidase
MNLTKLNTNIFNKITPGDTVVSSFYFNDLHGQLHYLDKFKSAVDIFRNEAKTPVNFVLSSGDNISGVNHPKNELIFKFMDAIGVDAAALGNHELDGCMDLLKNLIDESKVKFLSANLKIPENNPLMNVMKNNKLVSSCIIEKNGFSSGFIGSLPVDINYRIPDPEHLLGIIVEDAEKSIETIQKEVKKLEKKDVDIINLLSHFGYNLDAKIANEVSGIDVIYGGHSHNVLHDLTKGVNIFKSPDKEPVIITQAGKDGKYHGILNTVYDSDGTLKYASNTINRTFLYPSNPFINELKNKYCGTPEIIGHLLNNVSSPEHVTENPLTSFVADAIRDYTGADICLLNTSCARGMLNKGEISISDIQEILPFDDNICTVSLTEHAIVEALRHGATTITKKPEFLEASGLKYSINKYNHLKEVIIYNKNGTAKMVNIGSPAKKNEYTVAIRKSFVLKDFIGYKSLNVSQERIKKKFYEKQSEMVINYIKTRKNMSPFCIKPRDAVKFETKLNNSKINDFLQQPDSIWHEISSLI